MKKEKATPKSSPKKTQLKHTMPPRMMRLALALLSAPAGVPRESADKIAPASNGPHYIGQLRHRLALEIPCERVSFVTKDGLPSWYGLYRLTPDDRRKLREVLQ